MRSEPLEGENVVMETAHVAIAEGVNVQNL